ncbi:MAG: hypothetical protein II971_06600 [Firmicutes bacterium]|nr:hypothetical protein [Bacillota bacterium]
MSLINSFTLMVGIYTLGVLVSRWTGGRIGSSLFTLPIMMILFWTGLLTVQDVNNSFLPNVYSITMALILVSLGTTFNLQLLKKEWRLVLVCVSAQIGCGLITLTVSRAIFGRDLAFASFPVLSGGLIATTLMQDAAIAKGLPELAATLLLVMTVQGWISMPVISNCVRAESLNLLKNFDAEAWKASHGEVKAAAAEEEKKEVKEPWADRFYKKYNTPYIHIFLCSIWGCVAAAIANWASPRTGGIFGAALVGILLGIFARQTGLITRDPLTQAGLMPFFMMAMIMSMRRSLASLSPAGLLAALGPIAGVVLIGLIGLLVPGILIGKLFKLSLPMSIAVAIQAYSGYPGNFQISSETIEAISKTPEEEAYLKETVVPQIVIGGIISVSILSVIIGAVCAGMF